MKRKSLVASLIAAGLIGSAAIGYTAGGNGPLAAPAVTSPPVAESTASSSLPAFGWIAAKYGPAVVNVSVTGTARATDETPQMPQLSPDDPFYQFFKRFQTPMPRGEVPMHGLGSGFIVSSDGVILTNAHVVDGAKEVQVKLTDRREFPAKVVGVDRQSDVAVIKIDARDLPTVKIGSADDLKVGEWVLAIGSPFGFENTVTQGIVSAKSRSLPSDTYVPFIQTDVPVNPGNSGGPLFNTKGEVVGINSQIFSHSGAYEGLSFAIPIDIATHVQQQIVATGHVTRGHLGVTVQEVTQSLADSFGLKQPEGALVGSVEPGGPAAKAGLRSGDVILKFNGTPVTSSNQLPLQVADLKPGTVANVQVWRHGSTRNLEVTLGTLSDNIVAEAGSATQDHGRLGLSVRPLTPDERQQSGDASGLMVEQASGAAAAAGIQPGDVIIAMNGTPVKSAAQLRELVKRAGKHVALLVQRNDAELYVPLDLS
jgi:serine protease Do